MSNDFMETLVIFILSTVIIWTWGLLPPILIKVLTVKKSYKIKKWLALLIVFVLLLFNIVGAVVLKELFGDGEPTGYVWVIVAFVSYSILVLDFDEKSVPGAKEKIASSAEEKMSNSAKAGLIILSVIILLVIFLFLLI